MSTNVPMLNLTYLVSWDAEGIVKAGITERNRWRGFVNRGARLVALYEMPTVDEMFDLEQQFHLDLDINGVRAFDSSMEAVPYLGNRGGGYLECYRIPLDRIEHVLKVMIEHVPESAIELMPQWAIGHHAPSTSTDVTDGRTNEESGSVGEKSYVSNAHEIRGDSARWSRRMDAYRYAVAP